MQQSQRHTELLGAGTWPCPGGAPLPQCLTTRWPQWWRHNTVLGQETLPANNTHRALPARPRLKTKAHWPPGWDRCPDDHMSAQHTCSTQSGLSGYRHSHGALQPHYERLSPHESSDHRREGSYCLRTGAAVAPGTGPSETVTLT